MKGTSLSELRAGVQSIRDNERNHRAHLIKAISKEGVYGFKYKTEDAKIAYIMRQSSFDLRQAKFFVSIHATY